jgi:hypothetical protein
MSKEITNLPPTEAYTAAVSIGILLKHNLIEGEMILRAKEAIISLVVYNTIDSEFAEELLALTTEYMLEKQLELDPKAN